MSAFITASRSGDIAALTRLLASDARVVTDGGGKVPAALNVIEGADRVAAFLAGVVRKGWTDDMTVRFDTINGLPGLIVSGPRGLVQTNAFEIEGDVVKAIYVVRNPDKLRHLGELRPSGYNHSALQDLLARDLASLIHPLHDPAAHRSGRVWVRGHGAMLVDADGKEYIDGLAGLWNVVLGHGRRELAEAAREQLETLAYASGYCGSSNLRAIELAERLARLTYPNINRFFFTSGGAEANETAIKVARVVLEAARPARQDEGHLARARLPRHHAGRDERDGDCRILAALRAACPGLHSRSHACLRRRARRDTIARRRPSCAKGRHRRDVSRRARDRRRRRHRPTR